MIMDNTDRQIPELKETSKPHSNKMKVLIGRIGEVIEQSLLVVLFYCTGWF